MCMMCVRAVPSDMTSDSAMWRALRPRASSTSTSDSRGVGEEGLCARLHIGLLPHPLHIVRLWRLRAHDVQSREQEQREERQ